MQRFHVVIGTLVLGAVCAAPLQAQKRARPSPTLLGTPGARTAQPPAPAAVQPQAARPAPPAFTAGLSIESFEGDEGARDAYVRRYTLLLDSTIATLVAVFRGTSGQPMAGATAPTALSQRERDRWTRCRDLHWDLQSYVSAMHELVEGLPENAAVQRAGGTLDSSLTALQATAECDNVSSMIAAPDRWTPWGQQYATTARQFYTTWYAQVRDVQERNRAFIIAVNGTREAAERIPVPPAMPRNPPYAGAAVR